MGKNSKIEWTDHTFNPWWGCVKVGIGCANCYAESFANRMGYKVWGPDKPRRLFSEKHWNDPIRWNRAARKAGEKHRVFCASMCDLFEIHKDEEYNALILDKEREKVWDLIEETPYLIWMLLTKRPENISRLFPERWTIDSAPDNVWLGVTIENQESTHRIDELLQIRAPVFFLSCEPLLGPIDLSPWLSLDQWLVNPLNTLGPAPATIDWVIVGGESGPKARPMHPDWARSIRNQCQVADIPFFFKQWGEWIPFGQGKGEEIPELAKDCWLDVRGPSHPTYSAMMHSPSRLFRIGKKKAGHLLDGEEWSQWP